MGPKAKTVEEEESWNTFLTHSTSGVGGCDRALGRDAQARVQDDINLHNQKKKKVNASQMEVVQQT
jgi:hypothetical protein